MNNPDTLQVTKESGETDKRVVGAMAAVLGVLGVAYVGVHAYDAAAGYLDRRSGEAQCNMADAMHEKLTGDNLPCVTQVSPSKIDGLFGLPNGGGITVPTAGDK